MRYISVKWFQDSPDYPILIVSEIDDERWEHRKLEYYEDGRVGYADADNEVNGSGLGLEPWPELDVIRSDAEFELTMITAEEFDRLWDARPIES